MGHPQYKACIELQVNRVPVYDHNSLTDLMSESIVTWALNIVNWALNIVNWVLNIVNWVLKLHVQNQNWPDV